jgi:hypothetical protein
VKTTNHVFPYHVTYSNLLYFLSLNSKCRTVWCSGNAINVIGAVLVSNHGRDTGYPETFVVLPSLSRRMSGQYFDQDTSASQFIICQSFCHSTRYSLDTESLGTFSQTTQIWSLAICSQTSSTYVRLSECKTEFHTHSTRNNM